MTKLAADLWYRRVRRLLLRHVLPMAVLIYVGFGALLFFFQRDFIYYPDQQVFDECDGLPAGTEMVRYGEHHTRAYYKPGTEQGSSTLVVLYHGNAGSACDRAWVTRSLFVPAGVSFLLVEYTGYSDDPRAPSAEAIKANVRDTLAYVESLPAERIVLMGQSLGAAAAAYHAATADSVDGLFLSTPFVSLAQVAREQYPLYPIDLLLREHFDTAAYLAQVSAPVTIAYGTADRLAPPHHAQTLHAVAASAEKSLIVVPGATHNNIYTNTTWLAAARTFIAE